MAQVSGYARLIAAGSLVALGGACADAPRAPPGVDASSDSGSGVDAGKGSPDVRASDAGSAHCPVAPSSVSAPAPSFATEVFPLLNASCASFSCHDHATRSSGLFLGPSVEEQAADAATIEEVYRSLLAQSTTAPALARVAPGDSTRSFLMLKIDGCHTSGIECPTSPETRPCGSRMPLAAPEWPQAKKEVVRQWIQSGAPGP